MAAYQAPHNLETADYPQIAETSIIGAPPRSKLLAVNAFQRELHCVQVTWSENGPEEARVGESQQNGKKDM